MKREIYAAKLSSGFLVGLLMGHSPNKLEAAVIRSNPACDPKLIKKTLSVAIENFKYWLDYSNESTEAHI